MRRADLGARSAGIFRSFGIWLGAAARGEEEEGVGAVGLGFEWRVGI